METCEDKDFLKKIYKELTNNEPDDSIEYLLETVKDLCYDKYVIKDEDVSAKSIEEIFQTRCANDNRIKNKTNDPEYKKWVYEKIREEIVGAQATSLYRLIETLSGYEMAYVRITGIPTWFKYYCFMGVVNTGNINQETGEYTKRTDKTQEPFIAPHENIIYRIYMDIDNRRFNEKLSIEEIQKLITPDDFSKMYAYYRKEIHDGYLEICECLRIKEKTKKKSLETL